MMIKVAPSILSADFARIKIIDYDTVSDMQ